MLNQFSLRILTKRKSPQNKAAIFKFQILFIERSAVIDEGDYLFFKQVFTLSKVFLQIVQYLRKKKDAHFKPQSKSQRQSSCHYAVIIDIGD